MMLLLMMVLHGIEIQAFYLVQYYEASHEPGLSHVQRYSHERKFRDMSSFLWLRSRAEQQKLQSEV